MLHRLVQLDPGPPATGPTRAGPQSDFDAQTLCFAHGVREHDQWHLGLTLERLLLLHRLNADAGITEDAGHCRDHTVYLEASAGWLFAGDLYLGERIKYFRGNERIDQQIASLRRVLARLERENRLYLIALWTQAVMRESPGPRFRRAMNDAKKLALKG